MSSFILPDPCRVLLIEDSESDAALFAASIALDRRRGMQVTRVGDLASALAQLSVAEIDVIALDLHLPDSQGSDSYLRMREAAPDLPIVIMTGSTSGWEDLLERGAQDHIEKSSLPNSMLSRALEHAMVRQRGEVVLRELRVTAERANEAKTRFVASITHDIRTPLAAMLGVADVLLGTKLDAEQIDLVETARRRGRSLLALLNDALEISRIESGDLEVEEMPFDLRDILEDVVEDSGLLAHRKRVALLLDFDMDVPSSVIGDSAKVRQIVANLVANGVKFTDEGEVVVRVRRVAELTRIEVRDTGIGVSAADRERIFERFAQAGEEPGERGGSGLGLSICSCLAKALGGRVGSVPADRGSIFFLELPLQAGASHAQATPLADHRVLLIQHDGTERRVLAADLRRLGARLQIVDASQGWPGIERATAAGGRFDAVLIDCRIATGGLSLAVRLAAQPQYAKNVALMLPMNHRASDLVRCRREGVQPLLKPVRTSIVAALVRGDTILQDAGPSFEKPIHVLIADDSDDLRQLLTTQLKRAGCLVTGVGDGVAAVDHALERDFDAILMDVQMPVMDGLEATREIRRIEERRGAARVPIIALTAHGFREVAELCLEAGCDEHLAKPVEFRTLVATLERLTSQRQGAPMAPDDQAVLELRPVYLEGRRRDVEALRKAAASGDFPTAGVLGHRMKGSGGSYGLPRFSELGAAIEQDATARDLSSLADHAEEFARYVSEFDEVTSDAASKR